MLTEILKVKCVYGRLHRIAKADYEKSGKIQLPTYTRNGNRFLDTTRGQAAWRQGRAVSIHRANIQEVLSC
jgi:hypothetical protein